VGKKRGRHQRGDANENIRDTLENFSGFLKKIFPPDINKLLS
jgi:hypothetical protein